MEQKDNMSGKKMKGFNFLQKLGGGSFGTVYKGVNISNKQIVAIKVISKAHMKRIPKLQQLVGSQISILKEINNQNVIKFIDTFSSSQSKFIVTQFCNEGDLDQFCKKKKKLQQNEAVSFLKQILNGFKGLHEENVMHRDFKLENVLLHNHICKIADLGFAKKVKERSLTKTQLGTDDTMAPEVHQGNQYGWGADVWSLGVVFYQMIYGKLPFKGANSWDILKKIKSTKPDYQDADVSDQAIDFMKRCLTVDPKERITWKQIYNHALMNRSDLTLTMGLLRSKVNMQSNKTYYQKNEESKRKTVNQNQSFDIDTINANKKKQQIFQNVKQIENGDGKKAEKIKQAKQQIEAQFFQYQIDLIHKRNDMMFGINQILPLEGDLQKININHSRALYQICKNCYLQLKKFRNEIEEKSGGFTKGKYWKQFKHQKAYREIKEQFLEDELFAECLTVGYKYDIEDDSSMASQNMNRKTDTSNFKKVIQNYREQLTPFLKKQSSKTKLKFIKLLKALKYMQENPMYDVQKFNIMTEGLDVKKQERELFR